MEGESVDTEAGRRAYEAQEWPLAYRLLAAADAGDTLEPADLEALARSAYMLGRDDEYRAGLERAHHAHLAAGAVAQAIRCAFWVGHNRLFSGDIVHAAGWFERGQRLLTSIGTDCVEAGYLLIPVWLEQMARGDHIAGVETARHAAVIGERFGDLDLVWLARDEEGRGLLKAGRSVEGLRLVDEALIAAASGELSPVVTGIVYCNTIIFCHEAYQVRHARAWTWALSNWCDEHPGMVEHHGLCLVHKAEILQHGGAWDEATAQARRAWKHFRQGVLNRLASGKAAYRIAEIHRLRDELGEAERAYSDASAAGFEPQPGLALLRLAEGKQAAAAASIRRVATERTDPLDRASFLPAYVEIMLASDEQAAAREACNELDEIAAAHRTEWLAAIAAASRGQLALATGELSRALPLLREALRLWRELDAPYEAARVRVHLGMALAQLEDHDGAGLELLSARNAFLLLGARADVRRVDRVAHRPLADRHGLTERELEVLRLLKSGRTNHEIGELLYISEHTVARHVQNILGKLGVSSRTAAGAYAFEHELA